MLCRLPLLLCSVAADAPAATEGVSFSLAAALGAEASSAAGCSAGAAWDASDAALVSEGCCAAVESAATAA